MKITDNQADPGSWVLVLLDGTENDILGIWGPYASEAHAQTAQTELEQWPIDGVWTPVALKHFPAPLHNTGYSFRITNSSDNVLPFGNSSTNTGTR